MAAAVEPIGWCVQALPLPGRPMAATAQAGLSRPTKPVAAQWHDCTVLREHRGGRHLAAVAVTGLVWPEPQLLAGREVDAQQQQYRGWDAAAWQHAAQQAASRPGGRDAEELETVPDRLAGRAGVRRAHRYRTGRAPGL